MRSVLVAFFFASAWIACSASGDDRNGFTECTGSDSRACDCPNGTKGSQSCDPATASFRACECVATTLAEAGPPDAGSRACVARDAGPEAGASKIGAKKCQVCDFDTDPSPTTICPVAPACGNGSLGAPVAPGRRNDLTVYTDNGTPVVPDGGVPPAPAHAKGTCLDPQLRIRLSSLKVHKGSGDAYCIIEANDGVTSEAALTMKTGDLREGDSFPFPVGQGTLWGQGMPECTSNNLTLTYYCYKVVDNSAWSAALGALGNTAASIGGSPAGAGPYGWAFGLGGAAANAAAAAIAAAQKDENRIKVQQTIPVASLLDLTNGREWSVRTRIKDGCNLFGCNRDWDWELTVQAWGCADKLPSPK